MRGLGWRGPEGILLTTVIILAVLAVYRLATRESPVVPTVPVQEAAQPPDAATVLTSGPPPSQACTELLERIRSSSEKELDGIVDKMSPSEAFSLYSQLNGSDRKMVFSALPPPVLARKAHELLGIPEGCFRHSHKPGQLASSLVDIAMGTPGSAGAPRQGLSFATEIDEQHAPRSPRSTFRTDERKIYACFEVGADSDSEPGVLVRWSEAASGTLVYLQYLPFSVNRRWNFVYFEPIGNWTPGTYCVGFYHIGELAGLLAEGTYVTGGGN